MKKIFYPVFLIVISFTVGFFWFLRNIEPRSSIVEYSNFSVSAGSNATEIGNKLHKEGLIKNPFIFKMYVQFTGMSNKIQAGDYRLSPSLNLFQIVSQLSKKPVEVKVTIPEGFDREEVATKFAKSLDQDQTFINDFLEESKDLEGYLFPDTYLVSNVATPGAIVKKMKSNFDTRTMGMGLTRKDVILASIIEEETKGVEERPIVAGILLNRLDVGMALQVDVAPLTYKERGLPKDPIANPGLVSLKAAIEPATTDYWYYLHDPSGQIHYAKTLDEQNANIERYLR